MTPPRAIAAGVARTPIRLYVVPWILMLAAAALTPESELSSNQGDVVLYLDRARAALEGAIPYRDFPFEYPPLALVAMVVPYALWPFGAVTPELYKWLFAAWEALLLVALGLVLARIVRLGGDAAAQPGDTEEDLGRRIRSMANRLAILAGGAALAIAFRFDLFPTLLAAAALLAALENRPAAAGVAAALGILAKLFPVAIVPALAVAWLVPLDRARLGRFVGALGITGAVGLLPFVALAGRDVFEFLGYQALRGLQVESIGGGIVVLAGLVSGTPVDMTFEFKSVDVVGALASAWLAITPILTGAAFGVLAWIGWRVARAEASAVGAVRASTIVSLATASVLLLVVTSKVFSIQYVVWLLPFAALLRGRQFWLAAAAVALTMPIHPLLYEDLVAQEALPILVLNLRNALVLALTAWLLADLARGMARPARLELTTFRSAT